MKVLLCLLTMLLLTLPLTASAQTSRSSRYELRLLVLLPTLPAGDERTVLLQLGRNPTLLPAHAESVNRSSLQVQTNVRSAVVYLLRGGVEERRDYLSWQAYGGERQTVQATYRRNATGGLELSGVQQVAGFVPEVTNSGNEPAPDLAGLAANDVSPFQPSAVPTAAPVATSSPVSSTAVVSGSQTISNMRTPTPVQVSRPPLPVSSQPSGNQPSAGANLGLLLLALGIGFVALHGWRWLPLGRTKGKDRIDEQGKVQASSNPATTDHAGG